MEQYINESHQGKEIDQLKPVYQLPKIQKKTAHQVLVDDIISVAGNHPTYNYKFWLGKVHRSKLSMNAILDLVDTARNMDSKYNKGGFLSKRL